jgi:Tol biopolymer transport system component
MTKEPIKSLDFLPPQRRGEEFYEYISQFIDYILERYEVEFDYIADKYKGYYDFEDIPGYLTKEGAIQQLIDEKGFTPIYEILNLPTSDLAVVYAYLKVFRYLKGTKEGLEVIFDLLGFKKVSVLPENDKTYELEEWWEKDPEAEPYSFTMFLKLPLEEYEDDFIGRLKEFFRFYVYPLLKSIELVLDFLLHDLGLATHSYYDRIAETSLAGGLFMMNHAYYDKVVMDSGDVTVLGIRLLFVSDRDGFNDNLYRAKNDGTLIEAITEVNSGSFGTTSIHPDGEKITFSYNSDIYELELKTCLAVQITNTGNNFNPVYSPDGNKIAFRTTREAGVDKIAILNFGETEDNGDTPTVLQNLTTPISGVFDWSPDSLQFIYAATTSPNLDLYRINADDTGNILILDFSPDVTVRDTFEPRWNPNGSDAIFTSPNNQEGGGNEVFEVWRVFPVDPTNNTAPLTLDIGNLYNKRGYFSQSDNGQSIFFEKIDVSTGDTAIWKMDSITGANKTQIIPADGSTYGKLSEGNLVVNSLSLQSEFNNSINFKFSFNFKNGNELTDQSSNSNDGSAWNNPLAYTLGRYCDNALTTPSNAAIQILDSASMDIANTGFTFLCVTKHIGNGGTILRKWDTNSAYNTLTIQLTGTNLKVFLMGVPHGLGQELRLFSVSGMPLYEWVGIGIVVDIVNETANFIINQTDIGYTEPNIAFSAFSGIVNNNSNNWYIGNGVTTTNGGSPTITFNEYGNPVSRIGMTDTLLDPNVIKQMFWDMGLRD